jgi:RND family efflux transporter MFP subunit
MAGVFALEAFSPIDDETIKKLAEERGLNVGKADAKGPARLALPGETGSASAEIALESKGYIVPISLIQVSPKVSGTVMKLNIKEGMLITSDNFILAELEAVEYDADWKRAEGNKQAAKNRREDTEAQYDQALLRYKRNVALKERDAVSLEEFEAAEAAYRSLNFRKHAAEAELKQAEADCIKAKWRLDNTRVLAPIKGMVLSKKTEEGNMVNPAAFSNGLSASLCEMADLHQLEVDLSIAERDIAKLFKDQDCRVRAEAFPNRIYKGYISRIMPMGDRAKSSVPVRVKIEFPAVDPKGKALPKDEQGEYLRPEMGAIVTFLNRKK